MPQPGYNLEAYLANQTKCPISKFNSANKKRVNVQFLVKANGSITDVKVVARLHSDLDSMAKQVISNMPKWKPGKQNGQAVDVYYTQPVYFKQ
jgi:protein TonB